jgi:hypothetical protein
MNWAHVHLLINHIPVLGLIGGVLLLGYAIVRKSGEVKMLSFVLFAFIAVATIGVFVAGDEAQDEVRNLPGVTEGYIGRHEEAAEPTLLIIEALGLLSLVGLVLLRRKGAIPRWLVFLVFGTALVASLAAGFTAYLGGQIRHTEIRSDSAAAVPVR